MTESSMPVSSSQSPPEFAVLIPCYSLEDFPSDLDEDAATGLLAAWTVLWHPRLLAAGGLLPAWFRADSPPNENGSRLILVPDSCRDELPATLAARLFPSHDTDQDASRGDSTEPDDLSNRKQDVHVCGAITRDQWVSALQSLSGEHPTHQPHLQPMVDDIDRVVYEGDQGSRPITVADFYALGYANLQVQLATRRLRYSSNLDEVYLGTRVAAAASAWIDGDGATAAAALFDCYGLIARERDEFFTSDPHLINLTLCEESVPRTAIDAVLQRCDAHRRIADWEQTADDQPAEPNAGADADGDSKETASVDSAINTRNDIGCIENLLLSATAAERLAEEDPEIIHRINAAVASGRLGLCGGLPEECHTADTDTDQSAKSALLPNLQTDADAAAVTRRGMDGFSNLFPDIPRCLARLQGGIDSDVLQWAAMSGIDGVIPMDFLAGTGHRDE
ncbi:MAG: hypothetical protein AAFP69_07670, partial [Planctomycetota bacterium]